MGHTHGIKWNDRLIEAEIKNVMTSLGIKRMPTRVEMDSITQNSALSNKVMKTGGIRHWADKLGLKLKGCETTLGNNYEFKVKEMLEYKGYKVEKMSTGHPYDLLVNDYIKIDVKVSHYYHGDGYKSHSFGLSKKDHNCDIFICVAVDDKENIIKNLIIPSKFLMGIKQLVIGVNSKYDKFNNKFEYIDKFDSFYASLQEVEDES